jgi:hypothetical protein
VVDDRCEGGIHVDAVVGVNVCRKSMDASVK